MQEYLLETDFFDFNHPKVKAYTQQIIGDSTDKVEQAIKLYYAVRDDIFYNPYVFSLNPKSLSASFCLAEKQSYCIPKAVLLAAMARSLDIPSRIGLADVKNHISSQQLIDYLQSDVFVMHGFAELYLNGRWVKATPAFNKALCDKMAVSPLEFNGVDDSIFQEFNLDGSPHMEYLKDHGTFADVPMTFIAESVMNAYPHLMNKVSSGEMANNSLEHDIE